MLSPATPYKETGFTRALFQRRINAEFLFVAVYFFIVSILILFDQTSFISDVVCFLPEYFILSDALQRLNFQKFVYNNK